MSIEISRLSERLIKSTAEVAVDSIEIGEKGQRLNRNWMVIHEDTGKFILASDNHKMVWITPFINQNKSLVLVADPKSGFADQVEIPISDDGVSREVEMFNSSMRYLAIDDGEEAADWLQRFLDMDRVRLVHMPQDFIRTDSSGRSRLGFADSWSGSIGGEESLNSLNESIMANGRTPVPRERFGHDMWISGADPFDEDSWDEIRIGGPNGLSVAVIKPIERCSRTLVRREAKTLKELEKKDLEPLATLSKIRRAENGKTIFGQKLAPVWDGVDKTIYVGDKVEVMVYKDPPTLK